MPGAVQDVCRDALARWGAPGAVVGVLTSGKTEVLALGMADLSSGEPLRPDTTFRVASITKPFTATLALSLVVEGMLALDDPAPLPLPADNITIRHLLAHLGGFEGELGDLARFGDGEDALARVVAELPGQSQIVDPGRIWSYCNAGYWAVGHVCAELLGTTYEHALGERVLRPLGLSRTSFDEPEARGHIQPQLGAANHEPAPAVPYPRARRPSGGVVSTAPDLLRFAAEHLRDRGLQHLRQAEAETPAGAYGLGWGLERIEGLDIWAHDGAYGGFQTTLALLPDRDAAFTVLTNGDAGEAVVRDVSDAVLGESFGVRRRPPPTAPLDDGEIDMLTGFYASGEVEASVSRDGEGVAVDAVSIRPTGERDWLPRQRARPIGTRTFAIVGGQWHEERFDFLPQQGRPAFLRLGSRLHPRR
jgi:CubicO group peptidase (beta-lactamase class C family)